MIEVHHQPEKALSDGPQSLKPDVFTRMVGRLRKVAEAVGRTL
jgi:3-deoxy-7-phosphoheptulonate synthase